MLTLNLTSTKVSECLYLRPLSCESQLLATRDLDTDGTDNYWLSQEKFCLIGNLHLAREDDLLFFSLNVRTRQMPKTYWYKSVHRHFQVLCNCGSLNRSSSYLICMIWIGCNSWPHCHPVRFAVKSRRTRSPAATRRVWPSRSASVSSLRGRRFPTRSKRHANSWSWRTSSTPSS